jgi:hypothetical protein
VVSLCASAAGWVQMRCGECAADVAVTARVCSRCGAPMVGQPPVVVDTVVVDTVVADMVVGAVSDTAVSDAAGKAVTAGVAEQAPPEPYMPGSGERIPAELRLVLAGYVGVACGLFAGVLACAAASVFFFADDVDPDNEMYGLLFSLAVGAFAGGLWRGLGLALWRSLRVSGFPGCFGGPAIHVRPL